MSIDSDVQHLTILWRGSLASCNYGCAYCPFAKTHDDKDTLRKDRAALERFANWAAVYQRQLSVLITPWGEALIRNYYRTILSALSELDHVDTLAIQTNLSCSIDWLPSADLSTLALWCSYHPGETERDKFVAKIHRLESLGARYSVGVVGLKEHFDEIERLRQALPSKAYLWINAYKRQPGYYSLEDIERLQEIDPLFLLNNRVYTSCGRNCFAGETVISVLHDGTARRCHFIETPIGNIYDRDFEKSLTPRVCEADQCRCHIGYSHLKDLGLRDLFGDGFLERRPEKGVTQEKAAAAMARFDQH